MYKNRQVFLTLHWWQEGQRLPDIFTHPPGSSRRHLGTSVSSLRTLWQVDCGSPGSNADRRMCITAIWVLIAVQISYESSACGTAVLSCVVWLLATSRVDRLWLPYKAALPEGCELQINAELRVNVKRAAVEAEMGRDVDGKVRTHTGVQMTRCTQKIFGFPWILPHWAVQKDNN